MKHEENTKLYEADDGKMLIRISNNKIVGDGICLGIDDDINNYKEESFTEEQRAQFFRSIGMEDPKSKTKNMHKASHDANKTKQNHFIIGRVNNDNNIAIK